MKPLRCTKLWILRSQFALFGALHVQGSITSSRWSSWPWALLTRVLRGHLVCGMVQPPDCRQNDRRCRNESSGRFVISSECLFASQLSSLVTLQHAYGMWRGLIINRYKKWRQYWYILGGLMDTSLFWVGRFEMVVNTYVKWHQRLLSSVKWHRDNFVCPWEEGLSLLKLDQCLQYGAWRVYLKEFCYGACKLLGHFIVVYCQ